MFDVDVGLCVCLERTLGQGKSLCSMLRSLCATETERNVVKDCVRC